ncbi:hypothetical protein B566_EDAN007709 [Ephemera danica]|nr:hypothetical protein B566_EDAN007709 [Ephemera danica]
MTVFVAVMCGSESYKPQIIRRDRQIGKCGHLFRHARDTSCPQVVQEYDGTVKRVFHLHSNLHQVI